MCVESCAGAAIDPSSCGPEIRTCGKTDKPVAAPIKALKPNGLLDSEPISGAAGDDAGGRAGVAGFGGFGIAEAFPAGKLPAQVAGI